VQDSFVIKFIYGLESWTFWISIQSRFSAYIAIRLPNKVVA